MSADTPRPALPPLSDEQCRRVAALLSLLPSPEVRRD